MILYKIIVDKQCYFRSSCCNKGTGKGVLKSALIRSTQSLITESIYARYISAMVYKDERVRYHQV